MAYRSKDDEEEKELSKRTKEGNDIHKSTKTKHVISIFFAQKRVVNSNHSVWVILVKSSRIGEE